MSLACISSCANGKMRVSGTLRAGIQPVASAARGGRAAGVGSGVAGAGIAGVVGAVSAGLHRTRERDEPDAAWAWDDEEGAAGSSSLSVLAGAAGG